MISADSIRVVHPLFQMEEGGPTPTSALQLNVIPISSKRAMLLNKAWHSRMPEIMAWNVCNPCYAAEYKNNIYAIAMWSLPIAANRIKHGDKCLELRRMAISPDAPRYTASRMLSIMAKIIKKTMPHIYRLISYQDTGVHTGTIYKAAGWNIERQSEYISWNNHTKRPGRIEQSYSPKIRWGLQIRDLPIENATCEIAAKRCRQEVMELGI